MRNALTTWCEGSSAKRWQNAGKAVQIAAICRGNPAWGAVERRGRLAKPPQRSVTAQRMLGRIYQRRHAHGKCGRPNPGARHAQRILGGIYPRRAARAMGSGEFTTTCRYSAAATRQTIMAGATQSGRRSQCNLTGSRNAIGAAVAKQGRSNEISPRPWRWRRKALADVRVVLPERARPARNEPTAGASPFRLWP